tara:strand:+ start:64 stop:930 length:867 start_codon:yes stop_codon:yes gene_type:complete
MVKIEWNDSIEKSLDIMRQNVSKLSELSNQQYLAFKKRIEYMNLPLAILSGANAGAIFFLEDYSFGHYVNIGCGVASLVIAGVLSYDWCSGTYKKMEKDLTFHRDCENLSNQIKNVLAIDRLDRKIDGNQFLMQKFEQYKELVNDHSLIEKFKGNVTIAQESVCEQVEDMQEFLTDHWNIIYRPTLRRFKKKNNELIETVKKAGESVKTIIEPVVEPVVDTAEAGCGWFGGKANLIWRTADSETSSEQTSSNKEEDSSLGLQMENIYNSVRTIPNDAKKFSMNFVKKS